MNKNPIKSAFMDDQDVLEVLRDKEGNRKKGNDRFEALNALFKGDDGYTPEKGKDYFTKEEIEEFKSEILTGATPEKFVDYFTDAEIEYIIDHVREGIIDEVTPRKGEHYFDGEDGKDADEVDVVALKKDIIKDLRILDEKQDEIDFSPDKLAEKLNTLVGKIDPKAIKGWLKIDDVVKALKEGKLLELRDIKGARLDMNDQRWHGGGISNISGYIQAGTNITITGSGTLSDPYIINSTGGTGAFTPVAVTPTPDDTALVYTAASAITAVVINGSTYINGVAGMGGTISIVGTTITLPNPVGAGGSVFGIA